MYHERSGTDPQPASRWKERESCVYSRIRINTLIFLTAELLSMCTLSCGLALYDLLPCETYDYIVVGSGSAGATVANRLSEDPSISVLLLEAGGNPIPVISNVPFFTVLAQKTRIDWKFLTEPQKNACLGLIGQRSYWAAGKVEGGTSGINEMLYVRGNKKDYESWPPGWSFKDVLPYYLKSENNTNEEFAKSPYHSRDGPLTVSTPSFHTPLQDAFLRSCQELGYPDTDFNGERQTGCAKPQTTIKDGRRWSTKEAFIDPANSRKNFRVRPQSHVTQILFDSKKRATGVVYKSNQIGLEQKVCASKEVIVSCGAIKSPQLLMLSGIGPRDHLEEMKISVISDLPGVGQNLLDHYGPSLYAKVNSSVSLEPWRLMKIPDLINFTFIGNGPLSLPSGIEGVGFINTKYANASDDFPDIEIVTASIVYLFHETTLKMHAAIYPRSGSDGFLLFPLLTHSKGRGFVKLRSKNPFTNPIIDPKYLENKEDLNTLKEGLKFAKRLLESKPYKKYRPQIIPQVLPGCEKHLLWSDDYVECYVRTLTYTTYHFVGTCKMGDFNDPMTVVDSHLRVKGVSGLRVVDASIMPEITSGNTNAPTIMIGERAADIIKGINLPPLP